MDNLPAAMVSARGRQESLTESRKEERRRSLSLIHLETFAIDLLGRLKHRLLKLFEYLCTLNTLPTRDLKILGQIKLGNQVPVGSKIRSKKATRKPKRAIISPIPILYFTGERTH